MNSLAIRRAEYHVECTGDNFFEGVGYYGATLKQVMARKQMWDAYNGEPPYGYAIPTKDFSPRPVDKREWVILNRFTGEFVVPGDIYIGHPLEGWYLAGAGMEFSPDSPTLFYNEVAYNLSTGEVVYLPFDEEEDRLHQERLAFFKTLK